MEHNVLESMHLDKFETKRSKERAKDLHEKKLSSTERANILRQFGTTQNDMQEAAKRAAIMELTYKIDQEYCYDRFHEKMEDRLEKMKIFLPHQG